MDDIRAVVEAVGFATPSLFAVSEGGPLSLLFAATYPDRVRSMALYGTMARVLWAPDYPAGADPDLAAELCRGVEERWGTGHSLGAFIQGVPDTSEAREMVARYARGACTPRMARSILEHNCAIDVRPILSTVSAPTLVLHSARDPLVLAPWGRWIADHVPDARWIEGDADYHKTYDGSTAWFMDEVEEFLTGQRPAPSVPTQRVLATVLFTDIVGSTERAASVGDDTWRRMLDQHDAISIEHVRAFEGTVVKTTGDGVLATFDGPSRAVACARAISDGLAPLDLAVRAGVHTGELERRGDDVGGIGVHIGSRIAGLAGPGEVWVSRTVKDLTAGSGLTFSERGRYELKGVPDEWELYALTA
jgi:class 3 adenylate cyclase